MILDFKRFNESRVTLITDRSDREIQDVIEKASKMHRYLVDNDMKQTEFFRKFNELYKSILDYQVDSVTDRITKNERTLMILNENFVTLSWMLETDLHKNKELFTDMMEDVIDDIDGRVDIQKIEIGFELGPKLDKYVPVYDVHVQWQDTHFKQIMVAINESLPKMEDIGFGLLSDYMQRIFVHVFRFYEIPDMMNESIENHFEDSEVEYYRKKLYEIKDFLEYYIELEDIALDRHWNHWSVGGRGNVTFGSENAIIKLRSISSFITARLSKIFTEMFDKVSEIDEKVIEKFLDEFVRLHKKVAEYKSSGNSDKMDNVLELLNDIELNVMSLARISNSDRHMDVKELEYVLEDIFDEFDYQTQIDNITRFYQVGYSFDHSMDFTPLYAIDISSTSDKYKMLDFLFENRQRLDDINIKINVIVSVRKNEFCIYLENKNKKG